VTPRLILSLSLLALTAPAQAASLYVDAGVGMAKHLPIMESGTWWQADQPYHFDTTAVAWRAGLGVNLTDHWAIQAGYISLGTVKSETRAVADEHYDFGAGRCYRSCERVMGNKAWEPVTGWEAFGRYTWHPGIVDPYVTFGAARLTHRTYSASTSVAKQEDWIPAEVVLGGILWAARAGAGVCYRWVCGDVTYYHLVGPDSPGDNPRLTRERE
jgi:hypothetical protein